MQKSNQKLDGFISEITSGEAAPIPDGDDAIEAAIFSGDITELSPDTHAFYREGGAGRPGLMQDDWFVFSNEKLVTEPGILFWQDGDRFFARRLDQEQWDKFIKVAKVVKKFW